MNTVEGSLPLGGEQLPDEAVLEDENGSLKVNFLGLTPPQIFATLGASVPQLLPLRKNLLGLRRVLEVVMVGLTSKDHKTSCNTQIATRMTNVLNAADLLSFCYHQGHERTELGPVYKDLKECAMVLHKHVR